MRFDLADLNLFFLCVMDAGSITRGAAQANLAVASASERLRNIEAVAGVSLLKRHPRGVVATEAGEAFAHHARKMLHQQALLKGELRNFAVGANGTVRLFANTAAHTEFLPKRLAEWLADRPRLCVELMERTSEEIVRAVAAGLVEAGLVSSAVDAVGLQVRAVAPDDLALIVPSTHNLSHHTSVRLSDVIDEPFVGLARGSALQDHIDGHAHAAGRSLAMRVRMKTFEGLCEMVTHGIGLGIIPLGIAKRYRRRYGFKTLRINEAWARRELCVCFQDWTGLSPAMQSLLMHLGVNPMRETHSH